jgi:hypothetical protein
MRFGKNFVWLSIGKNVLSKGDTMIMLTSRPEVFASLEDFVSALPNVIFDRVV